MLVANTEKVNSIYPPLPTEQTKKNRLPFFSGLNNWDQPYVVFNNK